MWVYPILGFIQSNKANTERAQEDLKRGLAVLQAHLSGSTYLVGSAVTLADIVVCCSLLNAFKLVMDASFLAPYKAVVRWCDPIVWLCVCALLCMCFVFVHPPPQSLTDPPSPHLTLPLIRFTTCVAQPEFLAVLGPTKLCGGPNPNP